jgi:hypothetical protein
MLPLRELQSYFFHAIAHEPGKSHGFDPILVQTVRQHGLLSSEERVNIYAQMYFARLLDVLYEDFPRVAAFLGCERFRDLVRAYLRIYPSTHPSLRHKGFFKAAGGQITLANAQDKRSRLFADHPQCSSAGGAPSVRSCTS